jgi:hypothetical protein
MTHAADSPVKRETSALVRRRALIVDVQPHAAVMREKGRRDRVEVPWDAIYDLGLKLRARAARAEKLAERRKGKR